MLGFSYYIKCNNNNPLKLLMHIFYSNFFPQKAVLIYKLKVSWCCFYIPQRTVDNNLGPDRFAGPEALYPKHWRQPAPYLEVLPVHDNDLRQFGANYFPLLILLMYLICNNRYNLGYYSVSYLMQLVLLVSTRNKMIYRSYMCISLFCRLHILEAI